MDLHLMTYFLAVVDHGTITKAAQKLYISQPSLSQSILNLERRLGTDLFDRSGRRFTLTDDGRVLEEAARRILGDVDRAKQKVAAVRELQTGRVEIVTFSAFSIHPVITLVKRFRTRYPGITVNITDADGPAGIHTALRQGKAEIGVTDVSFEYAGMTTIPLLKQEMVLAMHSDLAVDFPNPLPRHQVRDIPLVLDLRASASRIDELVGEHNVVVDCAHPAAIWEFVTRGTGATVVPRDVADQRMPSTVIRSLEPPLMRPVGLVLRPGAPTPAGAAFVSAATAEPVED
ncbi:LysR family transcriptional regulator [Rhodococcus erythropolis]|uniref:LysR family transcriptional regulator n=1 Tax=Rhodococcus erythropolis TaxID=1833 RepID=UPI0037F620B3